MYFNQNQEMIQIIITTANMYTLVLDSDSQYSSQFFLQEVFLNLTKKTLKAKIENIRKSLFCFQLIMIKKILLLRN